jgi:hypothetical protein
MIVLGGLVHVSGLARAPVRFDVFAADPVDAAPEPAVAQSPPEPPRPTPIVVPPKRRQPQSGRSQVASARTRANAPSRVVASAPRSLPQDAPAAGAAAMAAASPERSAAAAVPQSPTDAPSPPGRTNLIVAAPVSVLSVAPAYTEDVGLSRPAESVAALAPPTMPSAASMAVPGSAGGAGVLRPVPGVPSTVAMLPDAEPGSLPGAAAIEPPPAESAREMVAAAARSEPASAATTAAGAGAPVAAEPGPPPPPLIPFHAAQRAASSTPPAPPAGVEPSRPPAIASAAPAPPRRSDPPAAARVSSPLGLGVGRLRIRLDGASLRTTDRETDVISGTLIGGQPERVMVQVDDRTSVPTLAGRAFATAVKLSPGINRVRVLAIDAQGSEAEEVVTVQYTPPATPDVAITSPPDGHTLSPDDPPLVTVEGQVGDPGLSTVWLVANDRRVLVPVTAGRFRHVVLALEPIVRVRAETESEGHRSATVTVNAAAAVPAIGLWLGDWPRHTAGPAQVTVTWRPNPARLEGDAPPLPLLGLAADTGDAAADVFYLRNARPGVYTFSMTYRAGATSAVRPVLYVAGAPRSLPPMTVDGSGRAVVARLLLPQGILWEQEDWFTGRSASGDTVTKFRFPEGVSWTERLGDLGR